jgi:bifunctional oligoribonuclease and PAP phosphatase NrnA
MPTTVPRPLLDRIRQGSRFLLTSHISPDGDAIGSALALARMLRGMGKSATVWMHDAAPAIYAPLPGAARIVVGSAAPADFPASFDLVVALECPSLGRSGLEAELQALPVVNVDHHLGNEHYGAVNWVDTAAPACSEMVFRIARALECQLDADTATLLYLGLVTDTGNFRFSNATAAAFDGAAAMVRAGARPEQVAQWLYESNPVAAIRLQGEMLRSLALHHGGRIATVLLTAEMFARAAATAADSEGLIDIPRSIAGVEAVGLLREVGANRYKVSLRSRGSTNVESIARGYGGGGHLNAAGFTVDGTVVELTGSIVAALTEALG